MHLAACTGLAALALQAPASVAGVLAPTNETYVKECGSCHMPFSPQLLPAASWRKVMGHLDDHFGDSAKLDAATQSTITGYLVANSADRAGNDASRAIMASLRAGDAPERITKVPYIAGLHTAVLDPLWNGRPRPKTLTECGVCHNRAAEGNYSIKTFTVDDEAFRGR
jgi:hypothetical protein